MPTEFSFLQQVPLQPSSLPAQRAGGPRTFRLSHVVPYGLGVEVTDLHACTWAELQAELNGYVPLDTGIGTTLDLVWIRAEPISRGEWTIQEIETPADYRRPWSLGAP